MKYAYYRAAILGRGQSEGNYRQRDRQREAEMSRESEYGLRRYRDIRRQSRGRDGSRDIESRRMAPGASPDGP